MAVSTGNGNWKKWYPRQRKEPDLEERGMLVYAVDFDDDISITGTFKNDVGLLLRQCIQHKIFSASKDSLAAIRTDALNKLSFKPINWDALRDIDTNILQPDAESRPKKTNILKVFSSIFAAMAVQSEEDTYTVRKVLYLSEFKNKMSEEDIAKLVKDITTEKVFVSFVVPEMKFNDAQNHNLQTLRKECEDNEYISILPLDDVRAELINTVSKKAVRPTPWNITLEIGADLKMNVSGYVCTRKNKSSDMKQGLLKNVANLPAPKSATALPPTSSGQSGAGSSATGAVVGTGSASTASDTAQNQDTTEVELAAKVVNKEERWEQNDGTIVDPECIVDGYYYGDKLVSFDEIQKSASYTTGEKCFKILLFCPKEQVLPYYLVEDGTDLIFAKKGENDSDLLFSALLQVLHNTGKVAVVRKIRMKNARLSIGVLAPDLKRRSLVYVNLSFADDITIPKFPLLFKPEELENDNFSEKDQLMDQFIMSKSIESFAPFEGPVDPAVQMFRESITHKILGKPTTAVQAFDPKKPDNIQAYFENLIKQNSAIMEAPRGMQKQLALTFPCREVPTKNTERAAGVNVFRKRNLSDTEPSEEEKKVKVEAQSLPVDENLNEEPSYADRFDVDNMFDDI